MGGMDKLVCPCPPTDQALTKNDARLFSPKSIIISINFIKQFRFLEVTICLQI